MPTLNGFSNPSDGAHWSPAPIVPDPNATTGRGPGPPHAFVGSMNAPVTATGRPAESIELYISLVALPGKTTGRFTDSGIASDRINSPGWLGICAGGS
ncbi:hypothetical protein GCM10009668_41620 [Nocardioides dubius]|uniref:Uncharacterized protein n=1 Tax=Nocardioides dubius TaxID=317019 RepID=A0ABN1U318_9ACTN